MCSFFFVVLVFFVYGGVIGIRVEVCIRRFIVIFRLVIYICCIREIWGLFVCRRCSLLVSLMNSRGFCVFWVEDT